LPESEDYLRRSVEKSPTAAACNDLAENLRLQKKLGEAESFARRSLELDPQLLPALDTLACVLYDAGRFEESAQTASKAVAAKPQHLAYQLTLLRAQIQTGDNVGVQQRTDTLKALQYEIPEEMKKQINKMLYPLQSQLHRP
jgi:tetratricopeptide (TPR) repeat protein